MTKNKELNELKYKTNTCTIKHTKPNRPISMPQTFSFLRLITSLATQQLQFFDSKPYQQLNKCSE